MADSSDLSSGSAGVAGSDRVPALHQTDHLLFSELWLDNDGMRNFMPDDFEPDIYMTLTRLAHRPSLYHNLPRHLAMQPSVTDCAIRSEAIAGGTDVIRHAVKRLVKDKDYAAAKNWIVKAVKYGNLGAISEAVQLFTHDEAAVHATVAAALVANGEAIRALGSAHWKVREQAKHVLLATETYPGAIIHVGPHVRDLVDANRELLEKHHDKLVQLLLRANETS